MHAQPVALHRILKALPSEIRAVHHERRVGISAQKPSVICERVHDGGHQLPIRLQNAAALLNGGCHLIHIHEHVVGNDEIEMVIVKRQISRRDHGVIVSRVSFCRSVQQLPSRIHSRDSIAKLLQLARDAPLSAAHIESFTRARANKGSEGIPVRQKASWFGVRAHAIHSLAMRDQCSVSLCLSPVTALLSSGNEKDEPKPVLLLFFQFSSR